MIDTIKSEWDNIISYFKNEFEISDLSMETWINPLKLDHIEKDKDSKNILYIQVPDEMFLKYVEKRYSLYLSVSIQEKTSIKCDIKFFEKNNSTKDKFKENNIINNKKHIVDQMTLSNANLKKDYTFDTFVVGKSNNIAHAASVAVAENPGEIYNPLFIYGGSGLGKTHLMQSIAHYILQNNPQTKILYVPSEVFTNDVIESIRKKDMLLFKNKYRNIDVFLIDDIQFIIGKESTQEEFFHTFNALYEAKKQLIISSDKPPKDFKTLDDRFKSRFEWGLIVDIQMPDYETRMAILRKKDEMEKLNIDTSVLQYIATNIKSNIRELEGALNKVKSLHKLENKEITLENAKKALKDHIDSETPVKISPETIIKVVAEHFNVSYDDLASSKRNRELVYPRQISMYLCREMTDSPLQYIGKLLGGKNHATVIHGIDKISTDLKTNEELIKNIDILKKKVSPH